MAVNNQSISAAQQSALLGLPAEIRNDIWRLVLPTQIAITAETPNLDIPPLMGTCRQVFCEIVGLFSKETKVLMTVNDRNGSFMTVFARSLLKHTEFARKLTGSDTQIRLDRKANISMHYTGGPHWPNLVAWAKAVHSDGLDQGWNLNRARRAALALEWDVGFTVLSVVTTMREMSWEMVESVLEDFHALATKTDADWA